MARARYISSILTLHWRDSKVIAHKRWKDLFILALEGFYLLQHFIIAPPWARLPHTAGLGAWWTSNFWGDESFSSFGSCLDATQEKDCVQLERNSIWALIFGDKYAEQSTGPPASLGVTLWEEWPLHLPLSLGKGLVWAKRKDFSPLHLDSSWVSLKGFSAQISLSKSTKSCTKATKRLLIWIFVFL